MNKAAPLHHKFFTPNAWLLIFFMATGAVFGFFRFFYGFDDGRWRSRDGIGGLAGAEHQGNWNQKTHGTILGRGIGT